MALFSMFHHSVVDITGNYRLVYRKHSILSTDLTTIAIDLEKVKRARTLLLVSKFAQSIASGVC